ncbi:hypothetical protein LXL04_004263 [Taraxacum kok-saghyz]
MGFRNGATMENIPDVLLPNIFIRLPAKQLAQMRCVTKSWNAILSQSSFIKSHLNRSIQSNNTDGILLAFPHFFSFASKPFTAHPSRSPHLEITDFIKLPLNPQSNIARGMVIGCVNGLICFTYGSNHHSEYIRIWNPSLAEAICIWNPSLSALITLPPYYIPSHSIQQYLRFGYDPKTDDYKVVKVTRHIEKQADGITTAIKEWLPVEVYSMRTGSWKYLITQKIPSYVSDLYDSDKLCVDGHEGHLHWVAEINRHWDAAPAILAFDLGAETFREMELPDPVADSIFDNEDETSMDLAILGGKLCVISKSLPDFEIEVWVMNEYGVEESWVKLDEFPPFSGNFHTYGFTSHSEFFVQIGEGGLGLYDPGEGKTKIFKFHGGSYTVGKVVEYVDSLVWVTPAEQREMRCCGISRFHF